MAIKNKFPKIKVKSPATAAAKTVKKVTKSKSSSSGSTKKTSTNHTHRTKSRSKSNANANYKRRNSSANSNKKNTNQSNNTGSKKINTKKIVSIQKDKLISTFKKTSANIFNNKSLNQKVGSKSKDNYTLKDLKKYVTKKMHSALSVTTTKANTGAKKITSLFKSKDSVNETKLEELRAVSYYCYLKNQQRKQIEKKGELEQELKALEGKTDALSVWRMRSITEQLKFLESSEASKTSQVSDYMKSNRTITAIEYLSAKKTIKLYSFKTKLTDEEIKDLNEARHIVNMYKINNSITNSKYSSALSNKYDALSLQLLSGSKISLNNKDIPINASALLKIYSSDKSHNSSDSIYTLNSLYGNRYGSDQGSLEYSLYGSNPDRFLNDPTIDAIINKYYPDVEITNDFKKSLFTTINTKGCSYSASINGVLNYFERNSNNYNTGFNKLFGYDAYRDVSINKYLSVRLTNYEYAILDYYLYTSRNQKKDIKQLTDISADLLNEENGRTKFSKKLDDNDVLGGQFLITSEIDLNDYLKSKGLISEVNYSIRDEFNSLDSGHIYEKYNWYEPTKLHYLRSIAPGENFNNNKTTPSYEKELLTDLSENGKVNIKDLKKVLKDGKEVTIGVGRTNLEGSNGLTYQVRGAHAISVVDVTKDDELIVSTWGEQCTLSDLDAINEIRILNIP